MSYTNAVTFAFIRPPQAFTCDGKSYLLRPVSPSEPPPRSLSSSVATGDFGDGDIAWRPSLKVVVQCLDFLQNRTRTLSFFFEAGDAMNKVYQSLAGHYPTQHALVCYTLCQSQSGHVVRPCVHRLLLPGEDIPERVVCQVLPQLASAAAHEPRECPTLALLVVNILIISGEKDAHVGHLPIVVFRPRSGAVTAAGIAQQLTPLLGLSCLEAAYVRRLATAPCTAHGSQIVLTGADCAASPPEQIALLFPTVDVGDVVRIDSRISSGDGDVVVAALQGTVLRHKTVDGVRLFDAQCLDSLSSATHEVRGLSCFQVIPL